MKILFFDTETTWFPNNKGNEQPNIIQLWAIIEDLETKEMQTIDLLFKSNKPIHERVTAIHWIKDAMVEAKPYFTTYITEFMNMCKDVDYIVGHKINFDIRMLEVEFDRLWVPDEYRLLNDIKDKCICTMEKWSLPWWKWQNLWDMYVRFFGKMFDKSHTALADTQATREIFRKLVEQKKISLV